MHYPKQNYKRRYKVPYFFGISLGIHVLVLAVLLHRTSEPLLESSQKMPPILIENVEISETSGRQFNSPLQIQKRNSIPGSLSDLAKKNLFDELKIRLIQNPFQRPIQNAPSSQTEPNQTVPNKTVDEVQLRIQLKVVANQDVELTDIILQKTKDPTRDQILKESLREQIKTRLAGLRIQSPIHSDKIKSLLIEIPISIRQR